MDQVWKDEMPPLREWIKDPEGNALVAGILERKEASNGTDR